MTNEQAVAVEEDLVQQMTLDECIAVLSGRRGLHAAIAPLYRLADYPTRAVSRLGVPALRFTDGPKGVNLGRATCFPVALARGASWNTELEYQVGQAMGREARAQGANTLGSTCLNIIRHPGWGRAQETFSADTVLMSAMGVALMSGIQSQSVLAVIKHYACNSIENSRFRVDVNISLRALHEIYLPHFKACVDAGAAGFMSAYNKVNGEYCGQNKYLLDTVLRKQWGFSGFVMSDFLLGTRSTAEALNAGLDMEMPQTWHFSKFRIKRKIKQGRLDEQTVRQAAARVAGQLQRVVLDHAEKPAASVVACEAHQQLALQSAEQSMVLLKNNGLLPLKPGTQLAVIGRLARRGNLGSEGSVSVKPPYTQSLLSCLEKEPNLHVHYDSGTSLTRAKALAERCDAVIVAAGLRGKDEGEYFVISGGDRQQLELPPAQIRLIDTVTEANKNTAAVLFGGSAIACGDWRHQVNALLMAWYPGMCGGSALANILTGRANPSGRLPLSFPVSTDDLPRFDTKSDSVDYDLLHDYRWYHHQNATPAYGFGHGLSYSHITYTSCEVSQITKTHVTFVIGLQNQTDRDAVEVVQLYLDGQSAGEARVQRELKGFSRVAVPAQQTVYAEVCIALDQLRQFDEKTEQWVLPRGEYVMHCGPDAFQQPLSTSFMV